jgi:hypothetical protein
MLVAWIWEIPVLEPGALNLIVNLAIPQSTFIYSKENRQPETGAL